MFDADTLKCEVVFKLLNEEKIPMGIKTYYNS